MPDKMLPPALNRRDALLAAVGGVVAGAGAMAAEGQAMAAHAPSARPFRRDPSIDRKALAALPHGEIAAMDAGALTAAFTARTLSPVEVAAALLGRIEAAQPLLAAYSHVRPEETMAQARAAEARMMAGAALGPLDGVPVSYKSSFGIAGWPVTDGSLAMAAKGVTATKDSPHVARMRALGAVTLGHSGMPDLGYCTCSVSSESGSIRNPWDLSRTTGGSSSGAGAAAAAGLGPIHFGGDGYGSIRLPAAWTGTIGFMPGYGTGLIARSVADIATTFTQVGPDVRWHGDKGRWSGFQPLMPQRPFEVERALKPRSLKGLRIAYLPEAGPDSFPADPEVMAIIEQAVARIADGGGVTIRRLDPVVPAGAKAASALSVFTRARQDILANFAPDLIPLLDSLPRTLTERAAAVGETEYRDATTRAASIWDAFTRDRPLDAFDVVLTPSVRIRPFRADSHYPDGYDPFLVPHGLDDGTSTVIELGLFNMLGGWSCFSIPCGLTSDGLPVGLQLCTRPSPTTIADSFGTVAQVQALLGNGNIALPFRST